MNSVILFLHSYANKTGFPLPMKRLNHRDSTVMFLPSYKTKNRHFSIVSYFIIVVKVISDPQKINNYKYI